MRTHFFDHELTRQTTTQPPMETDHVTVVLDDPAGETAAVMVGDQLIQVVNEGGIARVTMTTLSTNYAFHVRSGNVSPPQQINPTLGR